MIMLGQWRFQIELEGKSKGALHTPPQEYLYRN
jgi:hypothetical protein